MRVFTSKDNPKYNVIRVAFDSEDHIVEGFSNGEIIFKTEIRPFWMDVSLPSETLKSFALNHINSYIVTTYYDNNTMTILQGRRGFRQDLTGGDGKGHDGNVNCVEFSADGKYIVSGSDDKTVKIWSPDLGTKWNPETGKIIHTLTGHKGPVFSVAFSPDGKSIVSGSEDETVKIWSTETGKIIHTLTGHIGPVFTVAFSPDGKYVISGSGDTTLKLWSTETGKIIHTLRDHKETVNSVAFSPDGKYIVSGSTDKTVKLWSTETGKILDTMAEHTGPVISVAFSTSAKKSKFPRNSIISGSDDKTVKLWFPDYMAYETNSNNDEEINDDPNEISEEVANFEEYENVFKSKLKNKSGGRKKTRRRIKTKAAKKSRKTVRRKTKRRIFKY